MAANQLRNKGMAIQSVAVLIIVALSLAACLPVRPLGTPAPGQEATTAPAEEATDMPTEEATEEATVVASEGITPEVTEEPAEEATPDATSIAAQVSQMLAQQLQISPDQVEVVSAEPVDWPDACLGVTSADIMCAQVITPGYRIVLSVDGKQYEYHTNGDGSYVQLASAPEASIGDAVISWQQSSDSCQAAHIGTEGVAYGPCMGTMMGGKLVTPERAAELADFVATYAPFEAQTPAGDITFKGQGSTTTGPGDQRMIAEWARLVVSEVSAGGSDPSLGVALSWQREGGIAGFCDDLAVYVTGLLHGSSCRAQTTQKLSDRRMSPRELEQLYGWLDQYAPFTFHHDDGAAADSMAIDLTFKGQGSAEADDATQQQILTFAQDLYTGMSQ